MFAEVHRASFVDWHDELAARRRPELRLPRLRHDGDTPHVTRAEARDVLRVLIGKEVDAVEKQKRPRHAKRQIAVARVEAERDELVASALPGDEDGALVAAS